MLKVKLLMHPVEALKREVPLTKRLGQEDRQSFCCDYDANL